MQREVALQISMPNALRICATLPVGGKFRRDCGLHRYTCASIILVTTIYRLQSALTTDLNVEPGSTSLGKQVAYYDTLILLIEF